MNLKDFSYDLPQSLIAQHPSDVRDECRLLKLDRKTGEVTHGIFKDIADMFEPGDCLVLNDSRVIPARLHAVKPTTGAVIEIFLLRPTAKDNEWECLCKPGKKAKKGTILDIQGIMAEITGESDDGNRTVKFYCDNFRKELDRIGETPLPPYITEKQDDYSKYQTVYAKYDGSVAAPTAGLHFTEELLDTLRAKGVKVCFVTLHVGLGTFSPVREENIEDHKMHTEFFILPEETARIINETKAAGGRITAVGTTCCRVLESVGREMPLKETAGETSIFIYPGFEFHVIDRLITNFHLPESTLIMLVSAFAGRDKIMNAYEIAVREKYRFFSFGDAMFIH